MELPPGLVPASSRTQIFGFKNATEGLEEPSVRVDLFLVLRLQDEDDLNGNQVVRIIAMRDNQLWGCIH